MQVSNCDNIDWTTYSSTRLKIDTTALNNYKTNEIVDSWHWSIHHFHNSIVHTCTPCGFYDFYETAHFCSKKHAAPFDDHQNKITNRLFAVSIADHHRYVLLHWLFVRICVWQYNRVYTTNIHHCRWFFPHSFLDSIRHVHFSYAH